MKCAVWKYEITIEDELFLAIPVNAKFLSIQVQNGVPCIWMLVNPEAAKTRKKFMIWGTGHQHDESELQDMRYAGTFQLGGFVGHLFVEENC